MKPLFDWLDQRTGYRKVMHEALYEKVPGGARWRYVWGSTLTFAFVTQIITGVVLWMAYNPSSQTAWGSATGRSRAKRSAPAAAVRRRQTPSSGAAGSRRLCPPPRAARKA